MNEPRLTVSILKRMLIDPINYMEAMMDEDFARSIYDDSNDSQEAKDKSYASIREYYESVSRRNHED